MKYPVFEFIILKKQSFIQSLLKQAIEENAIIEINNFLAAKDILEIDSNFLDNIDYRYGIKVRETYSLNLEEFYAVILHYAMANGQLDKRVLLDLKHLQEYFELDNDNIKSIYLSIGKKFYRESLERLLINSELSKSTDSAIQNLENQLNLPEEVTDQISKNVRQLSFDKRFDKITSVGRISPDGKKEITDFSKRMRIEISSKQRKIINRLLTYWKIENLDLQIIDTAVKLRKGECCHFYQSNIEMFEEREATKKKYGYSKANDKNELIDRNLKLIKTGELLITNQRILFLSKEVNSTINLDKILAVEGYKNGVEVDKTKGRNPIYKIDESADITLIILNRLIKEQGLAPS
jgi:hypothetical protein